MEADDWLLEPTGGEDMYGSHAVTLLFSEGTLLLLVCCASSKLYLMKMI